MSSKKTNDSDLVINVGVETGNADSELKKLEAKLNSIAKVDRLTTKTTEALNTSLDKLLKTFNKISTASAKIESGGLKNFTTQMQELFNALEKVGAENSFDGLKSSIESLSLLSIEISKYHPVLKSLMQLLNSMSKSLVNFNGAVGELESAKNILSDFDFSTFSEGITRLAKSLAPLNGFATDAGNVIYAIQELDEAFSALTNGNAATGQEGLYFNDAEESDNLKDFTLGIENLASALSSLNGITSTVGETLKQLQNLGSITANIDRMNEAFSTSPERDLTGFQVLEAGMKKLNSALELLTAEPKVGATLEGLKSITSIVAELNQITKEGRWPEFGTNLEYLSTALNKLSGVKNNGVSSLTDVLKQIPKVISSMPSESETTSFITKAEQVSTGLSKFSTIQSPDNLQSLFNSLVASVRNAVKAVNQSNTEVFQRKAGELSAGLTSLSTVQGSNALDTAIKSVNNSSVSIKSFNQVDTSDFAAKTTALKSALEQLSAIEDVSNLRRAANTLKGSTTEAIMAINQADTETFFNKSEELAIGFRALSEIPALGDLSKSISTVTRVSEAVNVFNQLDIADFSSKAALLKDSFAPLSELGDMSNLGKAVSAITKLGQAAEVLNGIDLDAFTGDLHRLTEALNPLAEAFANVNEAAKEFKNIGNIKAPNFSSGSSSSSNATAAVSTVAAAAEAAEATEELTEQTITLGEAFRSIDSILPKSNPAFRALGTAARAAGSGIKSLIVSIKDFIVGTEESTLSLTEMVNELRSVVITAGLFKVIGDRLGSIISKSTDYVEALNLFTVAMGDASDSAFEYMEQVSSLLGIDPSSFMKYQGTLQQIVSGFGVVDDQATVMSKNLTQLGYDISSFFNLDIDEAMEKLQSGIAGELEPLRRIGYALDEATLQQVAYDNGIDKTIRSMTQAEKAQLRYIAIIEQSGNVMGDMARTLQSPANQIRVLKEQISQLGRAIGNVFIPIMQAVIPYLITFVNILTSGFSFLASLFGFEISLPDYGNLSGLTSGVEDTEEALDSASGSASDAADSMNEYLAAFDEINKISDSSSSGSGGSGGSSSSSTDGSSFDLDLPEYDFLAGLTDSFKANIDDILDGFKRAWAVKGEAVISAMKFAIYGVKSALTAVMDAWKEAFTGYSVHLAYSLYNALENINKAVGNIGSAIARVVLRSEYVQNIVRYWNQLFSVALSIVSAIGKAISEAFEVGGQGEKTIEAILENTEAIANFAYSIARTIDKALSSTGILETLVYSILRAVEVWKKASTAVYNTVTEIITETKYGVSIVSTVGNIINGIIDDVALVATEFTEAWDSCERGKKLLKSIAGFVDSILGFVEDIVTGIGEIWDAIGAEIISNLLDAFTLLSDSAKDFMGMLRRVWDNGGKELFSNFMKATGALLEVMTVFLSCVFDMLTENEEGFQSLIDTLSDIFEAISDFLHWLSTDGKPILNWIADKLPTILSCMLAFEAVKTVFSTLGNFVLKLYEIYKVLSLLSGFGLFGTGSTISWGFPGMGSSGTNTGETVTWNMPPSTENGLPSPESTTATETAVESGVFSGLVSGVSTLAKAFSNVLPFAGAATAIAGGTMLLTDYVESSNKESVMAEYLESAADKLSLVAKYSAKGDTDAAKKVLAEAVKDTIKGKLGIGLQGTSDPIYGSATYDFVSPESTEEMEVRLNLNSSSVMSKIKELGKTISEKLKESAKLTVSTDDTSIAATKTKFSALGTTLGSMMSLINGTKLKASTDEESLETSSGLFETFKTKVLGHLSETETNGGSSVQRLLETVKSRFKSASDEGVSNSERLKTNSVNAFTSMASQIGSKSWLASKTVKESFSDMSSGAGTALGKMSDAIRAPLRNTVDVLEGNINNMIGGLNSLIAKANSVSANSSSLLGSIASSLALAATSALSYISIPYYAEGGFPSMGQVFLARERGAELVGNVGGHTAVMNNDQIVSAVASGVARAVESVLSRNNQSGSQSNNVILQVDGRTLGKVALKEINRYSRQVGVSVVY